MPRVSKAEALQSNSQSIICAEPSKSVRHFWWVISPTCLFSSILVRGLERALIFVVSVIFFPKILKDLWREWW